MTQAQLFSDNRDDPPAADVARRVDVLVPYPVDRAYSYAVPEGMSLAPGDYVAVPLGNREVPGVVWDDAPEGPPPKKIKTILARYDMPPMPEAHRKFIDWTAQYSMSPKGFVMKMALSVPGALQPPKPATGYTINIELNEKTRKGMSPPRQRVLELLADGMPRRAAERAGSRCSS